MATKWAWSQKLCACVCVCVCARLYGNPHKNPGYAPADGGLGHWNGESKEVQMRKWLLKFTSQWYVMAISTFHAFKATAMLLGYTEALKRPRSARVFGVRKLANSFCMGVVTKTVAFARF